MSNNNRFVKWAARILAILFILFISMFAFDVFSEGYNWWETLVALFMHLIPSFFLLAVTFIAWRWPKWGGLAFILLGVISIFAFNTYRELIGFLIISLPAFVIGALFFWESLGQDKLKA